MKKEEFKKQVKELLDSITEEFKEAEKAAENKPRDEYEICIKTINDGKGIKCMNNIKHMSMGGAISLLDAMDKIKETIFEKMPETKKFYGSPQHELLKGMFSLVEDVFDNCEDNDCDGDCDDDE